MVKKYRPPSQTAVKTYDQPTVIPEVSMPELDINAVVNSIFQDVDFDVNPGIIGTLFPAWKMWDKNRKIVELQQCTQSAQTVMNSLSAMIAVQRDFAAKRTVDYDIQMLKGTIAKLAAEVMQMNTTNEEQLALMRERSERLAVEIKLLEQQIVINKEQHDMEMKLKGAEVEAREADAAIMKKKMQDY